MTKELVCIECPMGCRLTVTLEDNAVVDVTGHTCPKGPVYARQEAVRPLRVVTSLMRASNRERPFSVKTAAPVPKDRVLECARIIRNTRFPAPVRTGQTVITDVCGTGVDVIATQDVS
jgi:CxxC motif-containing protein